MNRRIFMKGLAASLSFLGLGKFVQAEEEPVFKYSRFFRNCDIATMDEFKDMVCLDDMGKVFKVPVIWATDDKAEPILQENVGKDDSLVVDCIRLPLINIYRGDIFFNEKICSYYHMSIRTLYEEHMNQILEQAVVKFHPKFKNKVGEYSLMSMINNYYPGGSASCVNQPFSPLRGDVHSALKHGKQGEWVIYNQDSPVRVLKHQLNMIVVMEGKP